MDTRGGIEELNAAEYERIKRERIENERKHADNLKKIEFENTQSDLKHKYIRNMELALECLYIGNNHQVIKIYKESIEIMRKYNDNYKYRNFFQNCEYATNNIKELHIKITSCYMLNNDYMSAYQHLNDLHSKNAEVIAKLAEIRNIIQTNVDKDVMVACNNRQMDPNDIVVYEQAHNKLIAISGDKTQCYKLMSKINWFNKKDGYVTLVRSLMNKHNITDYKQVTNSLNNTICSFELASYYLTKEESEFITTMKDEVKKHSGGLKIQLEKEKIERERIYNIDAQKNIYKWYTELEIYLKEGKLSDANTIMARITNTSSIITKGKDIEDIGLVYTPPSTFSSYQVYLNEQFRYFENDKKMVAKQQILQISQKLRSLVIAKYNKDLVIKHKTLVKILEYVEQTFKDNYHLFYKDTIPETLSETIAVIIFDMAQTLGIWLTIKKWFGSVDYDLRLEYDTDTNKNQRDRDKILYEITNKIRYNTDYVVMMPPFFGYGSGGTSASEILTAEVVKDSESE